MRNLISLCSFIFIALTMNVYATITSPNSNSYDATGTIYSLDKEWIMVRNMGSSIAKGLLVRPDTTTYDDGASVVTVTASAPYEVALCMADETIAQYASGKCLIRGYTDALLYDASITASVGQAIFAGGSSTAGYAIAVASSSIQGYHKQIGTFLDASATSGAIEAYLNM